MRRVFDVISEPRGDLLRRLIRAVAERSSSVMVVLRDDLGVSETASSLLARLEPHVIERRRSSSWPGTTLLDEDATTIRFRPVAPVLDQILSAADGLYEWQQPSLPEDLAFLRDDGTAILASISHERDAFLELDDEEYQALTRDIPELGELTRLQQQ